MKKTTIYLILTVSIIVLTLLSFCGCSSDGFKQEDFALSLKNLEVVGNKVTVSVEFENKSWRNGLIVSSGKPFKSSSMIWIACEKRIESDESIGYGYASPAVYQWIICKQKISKVEEFQLTSGIYEIYAFVDIGFENSDESLHYITDIYTIEIA